MIRGLIFVLLVLAGILFVDNCVLRRRLEIDEGLLTQEMARLTALAANFENFKTATVQRVRAHEDKTETFMEAQAKFDRNVMNNLPVFEGLHD